MQNSSPHSRLHSAGVPVLSALALALGCVGPAWAIEGGNVVAGTGSIQTQRNITTVNQSSDRMVVDWKNFDIARNQTVNFQQPGATSAVLNRVSGTGSATQILGSVNANGRVFVVNPNGVMFGRSAKVDVGSLVASSLDTSNDRFMKVDGNVSNSTGGGWIHFAGADAGNVENQGRISASDSVVLVGPQVVNGGTVEARQVQLHAADAVVIADRSLMAVPTAASARALVSNEGALRAQGGDVVMSASAIGDQIGNVVRNTGTIEATFAQTFEGGNVRLMAPVDGAISLGGRVSASNVVEATTAAALSVDGPMQALSTYDRAATGHDVRVAPGARINGKQATLLTAEGGNLDVSGRVNGGNVDLRGGQVSLGAPVKARYDVKVSARADIDQTSDVMAETGSINMEGRNIRQGARTNTRAGSNISLSTPDQGGVYSKDGVVEIVPPNKYRSGEIRTGNLDGDSVAIVSHDIELNGKVKSRGDVQVIAMKEKFICLAGASEACIALESEPGRVQQRGDINSTQGSVRYFSDTIDQQAGTHTRAANEVVMNALSVSTANIEAGTRVALNADLGATLKGRITAPKVELPANVRYEGGSVSTK